MIDKLSIVNACLATMGEVPLNTLEDDHSYKAAAESKIDRSHLAISARSLWFNTEWVRAVPQVPSKYVMIPQDVIGVEARSRCGRYRVTQRGNRLYDIGRNTYEFDSEVIIKIRRHLDFDELPYEAQAVIRDDAVLDFQTDFDADRQKVANLERRLQESRTVLGSEDIRQKKINLLERASVQHLRTLAYNYSGHPWHPHTTFPA